jgi:hypothetical protein
MGVGGLCPDDVVYDTAPSGNDVDHKCGYDAIRRYKNVKRDNAIKRQRHRLGSGRSIPLDSIAVTSSARFKIARPEKVYPC